jgi:hypothetical protein
LLLRKKYHHIYLTTINRYHYGIKTPTEKDCEIAEHDILKSSVNLENLDSADAYDELQDVLHSANTIINFYKQQKLPSAPATMSLTQNPSTGRPTEIAVAADLGDQPESEKGISLCKLSLTSNEGHLLKSRETPHTSVGVTIDDPWKWTVDHVARHCSRLMVQMSEDERDRFQRHIRDQGVNGSTLLCDIDARNLYGVFKLKTFGARAIILREVEDLREKSII